MSKSKLEQSWLSKYYEISGAMIISISIILFIIYGICLFAKNRQANKQIIIPEVSIDNTSSKIINVKRQGQIDSVFSQMHISNAKMNDSLILLSEEIRDVKIDNEVSETKVKTIAAVIGLIIAIVGFFGFKSLHDIREHTIKKTQLDAEEIAKAAAKETAISVAKETAKETAKDIATIKSSEIATKVAEKIAYKISKETADDIVTQIAAEQQNELTAFKSYNASNIDAILRRIEWLERINKISEKFQQSDDIHKSESSDGADINLFKQKESDPTKPETEGSDQPTA